MGDGRFCLRNISGTAICLELQAVEELLSDGFVPPCDVYLAYSVNEEISGLGAPSVVKYLQEQGITLVLVMDEGGSVVDKLMDGMDRPYAAIGITEKATWI